MTAAKLRANRTFAELIAPVEIDAAICAARDKRLAENPRFIKAPMTGAGMILPTSRPKPSPPVAERNVSTTMRRLGW
jgi:hypothetical protein